MELKIVLPDYDGNALDVIWNGNAKFELELLNNVVIMKANSEALKCFAYQMLYLVQNDLEKGAHIHYDDFFCNTGKNVIELIVEKVD